MTVEQKKEWLKNASDEELLNQLIHFEKANNYGKLDEDIELTRMEILNRMSR